MKAAAAIFACGTAALMSQVPEQWVEALGQVETGGVSRRGDNNQARGVYQFHKEAWSTVNTIRSSHSLIPFSYARAEDPKVSAEYAGIWLSYLAKRIAKDTGRPARPAEVFLAHNMGYDAFKRISFQPWRAPAARYDAAMRFENLCKEPK